MRYAIPPLLLAAIAAPDLGAQSSSSVDRTVRTRDITIGAAPQDSTVPLELVQYLLGGSRIQVGVPAEGFDPALVVGGRVLGSRAGGGGGMGAGTTIAAFPWERATAIDSMMRRLAAAGWSAPQLPMASREETGFVSSAFPGRSGAPAMCRNGETIFTAVVGARAGETVFSLNHQRVSSGSMCDPDSAPSRMNTANDLIPRLEPMPGLQTQSGGRSSGSDQASSEGRIVGRAPVAEVLEHYLKQLQASRWTLVERASLTNVALATFTLVDGRQRPWDGVLMVTAAPNANRIDLRVAIRTAR